MESYEKARYEEEQQKDAEEETSYQELAGMNEAYEDEGYQIVELEDE